MRQKAISICEIGDADQNVRIELARHFFFFVFLEAGIREPEENVEVGAGRQAEADDVDVDFDCVIKIKASAAGHFAAVNVFVKVSPRMLAVSQWLMS